MSDEEEPQFGDFADEDWEDAGDEGDVIGWGDYADGDNDGIDEGLSGGDAGVDSGADAWGSKGLRTKSLVIGDLYIISLDEKLSKERPEPFLAKLVDIQISDLTAHFEDEDNKVIVFAYTDESTGDEENFQLVRKTPNYRVLDIALVTLFDPETDDIGDIHEEPDYEISTEIREKKVYSEEVQRDDVLFHLIQSLNIYDKPSLIRRAQEDVDALTHMVQNPTPPLRDILFDPEKTVLPS